jgi:hypothetical protein
MCTQEYRQQGVATHMLRLIEDLAQQQGCLAVYLHVITYNVAAMEFYRKNGFEAAGELKEFYFIPSGRALVQGQESYNAYIFMKRLGTPYMHVQPGPFNFVSRILRLFWLPCAVGRRPRKLQRSGSGDEPADRESSGAPWMHYLFGRHRVQALPMRR